MGSTIRALALGVLLLATGCAQMQADAGRTPDSEYARGRYDGFQAGVNSWERRQGYRPRDADPDRMVPADIGPSPDDYERGWLEGFSRGQFHAPEYRMGGDGGGGG